MRTVEPRTRTLRAALALALALTAAPALGHAGTPEPEPDAQAAPEVLAPGWGELAFEAPAPGSYTLPALGEAADGALLDEAGAPVSLHEIFGAKVVVLSFIYTTCSDLNGCPLATAVLARLGKRLAQRPELREHLRLVSVSFDPANDTPAKMREYGAHVAAEGLDWRFLTAAGAEPLAPVLERYGQAVVPERDAEGRETGRLSHVLRVFLVDPARRIRNIYSVSFLHADTLLADVLTVLGEASERAPPAVAEGAAPLGAGDDKAGYETPDYRTRSRAIPAETGRAADLLALARRPALGLPPLPVPVDNPLTAERIALGRKLFFDRRLSLNDTVSCAMCHIPEQGFTSHELATAVGVEGRTVRRNSPTLYNVAYLDRLFHDGRETRLEQQVWAPLLARNEMGNPSIGWVLAKIRRMPDYAGLFEGAFAGRGPTMETVGQALASYQRTLVSADSPFDRWRYGGDETALSAPARRGFALFTGKAGCAACHSVGDAHALFTDSRMHNTGVGYAASMGRTPATRTVTVAPGVTIEVDTASYAAAAETPPSDLGLYELTQDPADRWKYRTPSLRNVALTAPYMHDGSLATLREVVEFYDRGGVANEVLDPLIRPLGLAPGEVDDLVAFLEALTGTRVATLVADARAAPIGDLGTRDPNWSHANRMPF